jgi:WD40 repeat protein
VGTPESLGWMGPSCGPCHDLALERGEAPAANGFPDRLTDARSELLRLAISPDGSKVAATDTSGRVHYWTFPDRSHTIVRSDLARILPGLPFDAPLRSETLDFTGDGKTLIPDTVVRGPQLIGLDVSTDPPTEIPLTAPGHAPRAILPWRDGTFCRVWPDGLEWVDPQTREPVRRLRVPMGDVWQAIPSADCSRLFVRVGNRCTVIDPDDGQILLRPEIWDRDGLLYRREYPIHVAFSKDFRTLIVAHHIRLNRIDGLTGRNLKTVIAADLPFTQKAYPATFAGLAFEATGERFIAGVNSGGLIVYRTQDLAPLADFRWHLGFARAYATTADGDTALTGESDGTVKFWPLTRLLKTIP